MPDEVLRMTCQLACLGFAAFTAAIAYFFVPRW
jgi:hypothetical protein